MSTELTADKTHPEPAADTIDRLVERLVGLLAGSTIAGLVWSVDYYPAQPTEEKSVVTGETALVHDGQRDRVAVTITAPPGTLPAVAQAEVLAAHDREAGDARH